MDIQSKAILAGIFFGIWPLLMNRSGLNGNISSACFSAIVLIGVLPFAIHSSGMVIPTANWNMVILAGAVGALGLLSFNGVLANASLQNVGTLFVIMTLVQIVVAALYQTWMNGGISLERFMGFLLAGVASYMLLR